MKLSLVAPVLAANIDGKAADAVQVIAQGALRT
jgi:hypothetical protein